jgi:ATP adenylyltransferase
MRILDKSRHAYNSARKNKKKCFFCDSEVISAQNCTFFSYNHWYVLVNKHPYQNGNVMLVPKKHKTKLSQLSEFEWIEFSKAIVEVQMVLKNYFKTESFNIGINEGKASGRSVSHLHWQIIPRWFKNPNAVGVFADIHVVTMSPFELKEILKKNDI